MAILKRTWDGLPGSTLVASESKEHRYYGCFTELRGPVTEVWWTDDGTSTGTTLFDAGIMPWVEVQITGAGDLRDFMQEYYGGPMYNQEESVNAYAWTTWYDASGRWATTVFREGEPNYAGSTTMTHGTTVFLHAVGDGG